MKTACSQPRLVFIGAFERPNDLYKRHLRIADAIRLCVHLTCGREVGIPRFTDEPFAPSEVGRR